jgi:hypothetical protein
LQTALLVRGPDHGPNPGRNNCVGRTCHAIGTFIMVALCPLHATSMTHMVAHALCAASQNNSVSRMACCSTFWPWKRLAVAERALLVSGQKLYPRFFFTSCVFSKIIGSQKFSTKLPTSNLRFISFGILVEIFCSIFF